MSRFRPRNQSYWLAHLFESNYGKLRLLIPDLLELNGDAVAVSSGKPALALTLIERSRYTLTIDLHYRFDSAQQRAAESRFRIRVYLDGKCAEALHEVPRVDESAPNVQDRRRWAQRLEDKWSANYFLERWLSHCLQSRYRFARSSRTEEPSSLASELVNFS